MKDIQMLHEAFVGLLRSSNQPIKIEDNEDYTIVRVIASGILFIENGTSLADCSRYFPRDMENRAMNCSPLLEDRWAQATDKEIIWSAYVRPSLLPVLPENRWARFITTCRYDDYEEDMFTEGIKLQPKNNSIVLKRGQIIILPDMEIVGFQNGLELLFKIKDMAVADNATEDTTKNVPKTALLCRKENKWHQNISKTSMSRL